MPTNENYGYSASPRGDGIVHRVSWGAILAGAVVAVALMILFTTFGIGIGATAIDPQFERNPTEGIGIGSGIYLIVTNLIALGAGGYVAARMAGVPRMIASVLHGAAVWSVATIFLAWASVTGAGAMFGAAGSLLSGAADTVVSTGQAVLPDDISLPDPSELADQLSIDDLPDEVQATLRENGITEANLRQEAQTAFRNVFSESEQQAAMARIRQAMADIIASPGNIDQDLDALMDDMVGGPNAILSEEDKEQALAVLERRLGVTPQEAEQMVATVQSRIRSAITQMRETAEAARAQAIEAAQATSDAIASVALLVSLALLLGLAAACGGAYVARPDDLIGDRLDDHG